MGAAALLSLLLPALLPPVADGLKGVFNWVTGGATAEPANVDERIKLMQAQTAQAQAIAALDAPVGNISTWVADLRASFRYIAAGAIILGGLGLLGAWIFLPPGRIETSFVQAYFNSVVGPVFSFMFGDRLYIGLKKK